MNRKSTLILIEILAFTMIICVGFSSWILCTSLDYEFIPPLKSSISSENITSYPDYVWLTGIEPFTLSTGGFFGSSSTYSASMTANFQFDYAKCKQFVGEADNIRVELELSLSCDDAKGIFANDNNNDNNIEITANAKETASNFVSNLTTSPTQTSRKVQFTLSLSENVNTFSIVFSFDTKNNDNYLKLFETFYTSTNQSTGAQFVFKVALSKPTV